MWTEKQVIGLVRRLQESRSAPGRGRRRPALVAGIGDDTAVLRARGAGDLLITTDLFIEGIHFRSEWMAAVEAGRRAIGRVLSDIAAMGGRPHWAFLSLALPERKAPAWVQAFLRGFAAGCRAWGVVLAGGDTGGSGSDAFVADVIVCGDVPRGTAVLRRGARPGDQLFVSGKLGATAAALASGRRLPPVRPRLALGQFLREGKFASAMIDLSDGLSTDLGHICEESRVGAEIEAARLPLGGTIEQALHGGEDYELLFTVPARRASRLPRKVGGVAITRIGTIVEGRAVRLILPDGRRHPLVPGGWEHKGAPCLNQE